MLSLVFRFLVALFLSLPVAAQTENFTSTDLADFQRAVQRLAQSGEMVGLSVAVVSGGEVAWESHHGVREQGAAAKVDGDTIYRLASLSKGFSASLAALLVEDGKLTWNTPATRFAPDLQLMDARPPTLEHLLSHRTGLPPNAYDNLLEAGIPVPNIVSRLGEVDPICPVGSCYGYQNITYALVEPAIEQSGVAAFCGVA